MMAQSVVNCRSSIRSAAVRNAAVPLRNGRRLAGQMACHIPFQLRIAGSRKRTVAARVTSATLAIPSAGAKKPGTDLETIPAVDLPVLTEVLVCNTQLHDCIVAYRRHHAGASGCSFAEL